MNKFLRSGLTALFFSLLLSAISVTEARAQVLGEILRRMDAHNKALQSLQSSLTMVKHNPQLGTTDTTVGTISLLPKTAKRVMYARIDWKTENGRAREESMSVIGDKFEMYQARANQVTSGATGGRGGGPSGPLAFMTMSRDQLRASYDIAYLGEEQIAGGTQTWRLKLTPKGGSNYKWAEIWVDGDGMPRQAKRIELNDDTTTVFLSNIQKNVTLKPDIFKLKYPSSAKRVKG